MMTPNQLKLSIVYTDLCLGGIQRKIIDLLNYIQIHHIRIDPQVILRWETEFSLTKNLLYSSQKIYLPPRFIPFSRRRLPFLWNIVFHLTKNHPNVLLTHVFGSSLRAVPFARIVFGKKIKIIISQDNIFSYENPEWYARLLVNWVYSMANVIIVQTAVSKNDLVENWHIDKKKITVIPNWSRKIAKPNNNTPRPIDVMYCGRFEAQKNLLQLLKICQFVIKKKPNLTVTLIGMGRHEQMLKRYVINHHLDNNIQFIQPVNDIEQYMYQSKIFTLTSKFEGQPMTLLEAMSCECIPVCMNFPGITEYINNNYNGYIANTEKEMAMVIIKCLDAYEQTYDIRQKARRTVMKNYSEKNIQKYIDLISASTQ